MTLIVNIFGGPGAGKSTTAAGVFHHLKMRGIECELITEYAKDIVWEEAFTKLNNQLYVFAKQHNRVFRCLNKVDVIITDSPVNLGLIYGDQYNHTMSDALRNLIRYEFGKQKNLNVVLERCVPFNETGRMQTEEEARGIDDAVMRILEQDSHPYVIFRGDDLAAPLVVNEILKIINENNK